MQCTVNLPCFIKQLASLFFCCTLWVYNQFYTFYPRSLSLKASRECQSKEKLLEQGFRSAFREFQQWLVNAKINTAKCFDVPQNLSEASSSLQKIQVQKKYYFVINRIALKNCMDLFYFCHIWLALGVFE